MEIWDLAESDGLQDANHENPAPLVHEGAFPEHLNLQHQPPNINTTDTELPKTVTTDHLDSAPNSLSSLTLQSPTG